jgi:hypothetical protein
MLVPAPPEIALTEDADAVPGAPVVVKASRVVVVSTQFWWGGERGWRVAGYGRDPCPCAVRKPRKSTSQISRLTDTVIHMGDRLSAHDIPNSRLTPPPELRSTAAV